MPRKTLFIPIEYVNFHQQKHQG